MFLLKNNSHKDQVKQFLQTTSTSDEKIASKYLKNANWNVEKAIQAFKLSSTPISKVSKAKISKLFTKYQDPESGTLFGNGLKSFVKDLGIKSNDPIFFRLCHLANGEDIFEWTEEEFVRCFTTLGAETIDELKDQFPQLRKNIANNNCKEFITFYNWIFEVSLDKDEDWTAVPKDMAIELWRVALHDRWDYLSHFLNYVKDKHKYAITKDTWSLLIEFINTTKGNLGAYDPFDAWPVLIDNWVEDYNKNPPSTSTETTQSSE